MKLELQKLNIDEGSGQSFAFEESSVGDLPGVTLLEPVRGQFMISNLGAGYRLNGTFGTRVSQPCARCMEPVKENVEFEIDEMYLPSGQEESDQEDVFVLNSEVLDVTDVVRQNLLMEVKEFPLCTADCKGLCPVCGANLNTTACSHQHTVEENQ